MPQLLTIIKPYKHDEDFGFIDSDEDFGPSNIITHFDSVIIKLIELGKPISQACFDFLEKRKHDLSLLKELSLLVCPRKRPSMKELMLFDLAARGWEADKFTNNQFKKFMKNATKKKIIEHFNFDIHYERYGEPRPSEERLEMINDIIAFSELF